MPARYVRNQLGARQAVARWRHPSTALFRATGRVKRYPFPVLPVVAVGADRLSRVLEPLDRLLGQPADANDGAHSDRDDGEARQSEGESGQYRKAVRVDGSEVLPKFQPGQDSCRRGGCPCDRAETCG